MMGEMILSFRSKSLLELLRLAKAAGEWDGGMVTTAEGVESAEQLALLRREGCTQAQGYLFSKPRPAAEVERLLSGSRASAVA
jgi:EAL domain-containing protein (putative c-di-GMP-specific phosphodiesterase class I)